jgi:hypothetical protein
MFRKTIISLVAIAALGASLISMTSAADAHRRHHHGSVFIDFGVFPFVGSGFPVYHYGNPSYGFRSRADRFAYPSYYDSYYDYDDCGYRRVLVKKWNKAHTHRIKVYKKRWICY